MQKMFLLVGLFVTMVTVATGACRTNDEAAMYTDEDRYVALLTVINVTGGIETPQLTRMIRKDATDGVAILIPSGTPIKVLKKLDNGFAVVEINGTVLFRGSHVVTCD
jgi:hypothetical protein